MRPITVAALIAALTATSSPIAQDANPIGYAPQPGRVNDAIDGINQAVGLPKGGLFGNAPVRNQSLEPDTGTFDELTMIYADLLRLQARIGDDGVVAMLPDRPAPSSPNPISAYDQLNRVIDATFAILDATPSDEDSALQTPVLSGSSGFYPVNTMIIAPDSDLVALFREHAGQRIGIPVLTQKHEDVPLIYAPQSDEDIAAGKMPEVDLRASFAAARIQNDEMHLQAQANAAFAPLQRVMALRRNVEERTRMADPETRLADIYAHFTTPVVPMSLLPDDMRTATIINWTMDDVRTADRLPPARP